MGNRMLASLALASSLVLVGVVQRPAAAQTQPVARVVDFVVESVVEDDGQLIATAAVTLDVAGRTITRNVEIPLDLGATSGAEGECDILNLALGPVDLDLLGLVVELDDCNDGPVTVDITALEGEGLLGDLLCGIAGLLDDGLDLGSILDMLTEDDLAVVTDGLRDLLNVIVGQVLDTGDVGAQQVDAPGSHRCDILTLEIPEGIELELLGLLVETSGICLDVYAERGSGNLLGNLLCSLTNLLNNGGNNAIGQQALTRNVLRLLDRLGL